MYKYNTNEKVRKIDFTLMLPISAVIIQLYSETAFSG